jgi:signal transduction histidine kinase
VRRTSPHTGGLIALMTIVPSPALQKDRAPRISVRLLLWFSFALLLMMIVLSTVIFGILSTSEQRQWQSRQTEATRNASLLVLSFFDAVVRDLAIAAQFSDLTDHPNVPEDLITDNPALIEVIYVSAQGDILANPSQRTSLLATEADITQAAWFVQGLAASGDEPFIGAVQTDANGLPYLTLSAAAEEFEGVVAVRLSLQEFSFLVGQLTMGETGQAYVVSETGALLAHSDPALLMQGFDFSVRPEYVRAPMFATETGEYENFLGEYVVGTFERIPALNWVIFTEVAEDEVYAGTTAVLQALAVTLVGVFIVTLLGTTGILQRFIFAPLSSLRRSLEQVAQGDLNAQLPVQRRDEVGEVTTAFNDMIRIVGERTIERERLIRELQAAKRMAEENSRLKSEFLSTMSHELRTPMNAIEGFVGIILSRMGGTEYNEKTGSYLLRVRANSQRLLALINDFLDLSRVESGRLELAHLPFEPARLAQRWHAELGVLAESKGIGFEVRVDPTLPKTLVGDEEAISKVAINLLSNAIKFTEKGKVALAMTAAGDQWNIAVTDTGIGIPAHAREYVFEEFRQVDQTSKRKYGGTGLGLAIVQKYSRSMGGQVTLRSEVGKGSEFTVTLPLMMPTQIKRLQEV